MTIWQRVQEASDRIAAQQPKRPNYVIMSEHQLMWYEFFLLPEIQPPFDALVASLMADINEVDDMKKVWVHVQGKDRMGEVLRTDPDGRMAVAIRGWSIRLICTPDEVRERDDTDPWTPDDDLKRGPDGTILY